jgi:hypothetical protein
LRVVAYVPDLLFGSNVVEGLRAAGHEPVLVADPESARRELASAQVLVVDLTADAADRLEAIGGSFPPGVRTLAFYSHVESDVRESALRAGFDLVVPRSRMAREGGALVDRLSAAGAG